MEQQQNNNNYQQINQNQQESHRDNTELISNRSILTGRKQNISIINDIFQETNSNCNLSHNVSNNVSNLNLIKQNISNNNQNESFENFNNDNKINELEQKLQQQNKYNITVNNEQQQQKQQSVLELQINQISINEKQINQQQYNKTPYTSYYKQDIDEFNGNYDQFLHECDESLDSTQIKQQIKQNDKGIQNINVQEQENQETPSKTSSYFQSAQTPQFKIDGEQQEKNIFGINKYGNNIDSVLENQQEFSNSSLQQDQNSIKNRNNLISQSLQKSSQIDQSQQQSQKTYKLQIQSSRQSSVYETQSSENSQSQNQIFNSGSFDDNGKQKKSRFKKNFKNMKKNVLQKFLLQNFFRKVKNSLQQLKYSELNRFHFETIMDQSSSVINSSKQQKNKHPLLTKIQEILVNQIPVALPLSPNRFFWDILIILILCNYFLVIPLVIAFNKEFKEFVGTDFIHSIYIGILVIDIFVNCNTAVYQKGVLILQRKKIWQLYYQDGLKSDLSGLISCFLYKIKINNFEYSNFVQLLFFLKVYNFKRIYSRIEVRFRLKPKISNIFNLANLLVIVLYICHLFASVWIFMGRKQIEATENFDTWMEESGIQDKEWGVQFLHAYYFMTVTMVTVGYGDMGPTLTNNYEIILCIITMLIACGVFGFVMNKIGLILESMQQQEEENQKNTFAINNWMAKKNVDMDLQYQVREYLSYYWKQQNILDVGRMEMIMDQLSNKLKQNLLKDANKIVLNMCPIFKNNFSQETIQQTIHLIKEMLYLPEEVVYKEGDQEFDSSIFFIEKGRVEIFQMFEGDSKYSKAIKILEQGQYFGQISFFTGGPRKVSIKALDFTTILKVNRSDFLELIEKNEKDFERFMYIKDMLQYSNNLEVVNEMCISCNKVDHVVSKCQYMHFIPNVFRSQRKFNYSKFQERQRYYRSRPYVKAHPWVEFEINFEAAEDAYYEHVYNNQQTSQYQLEDDYDQEDEKSESSSEQQFNDEENYNFNKKKEIKSNNDIQQQYQSLLNQNGQKIPFSLNNIQNQDQNQNQESKSQFANKKVSFQSEFDVIKEEMLTSVDQESSYSLNNSQTNRCYQEIIEQSKRIQEEKQKNQQELQNQQENCDLLSNSPQEKVLQQNQNINEEIQQIKNSDNNQIKTDDNNRHEKSKKQPTLTKFLNKRQSTDSNISKKLSQQQVTIDIDNMQQQQSENITSDFKKLSSMNTKSNGKLSSMSHFLTNQNSGSIYIPKNSTQSIIMEKQSLQSSPKMLKKMPGNNLSLSQDNDSFSLNGSQIILENAANNVSIHNNQVQTRKAMMQSSRRTPRSLTRLKKGNNKNHSSEQLDQQKKNQFLNTKVNNMYSSSQRSPLFAAQQKKDTQNITLMGMSLQSLLQKPLQSQQNQQMYMQSQNNMNKSKAVIGLNQNQNNLNINNNSNINFQEQQLQITQQIQQQMQQIFSNVPIFQNNQNLSMSSQINNNSINNNNNNNNTYHQLLQTQTQQQFLNINNNQDLISELDIYETIKQYECYYPQFNIEPILKDYTLQQKKIKIKKDLEEQAKQKGVSVQILKYKLKSVQNMNLNQIRKSTRNSQMFDFSANTLSKRISKRNQVKGMNMSNQDSSNLDNSSNYQASNVANSKSIFQKQAQPSKYRNSQQPNSNTNIRDISGSVHKSKTLNYVSQQKI